MFNARTKYAGKFKALFEVLFQNMTSACFTIGKDGLHLEHKTTQNIVISVFLPAETFEEYIFDEQDPIHIGLGVNVNKEFFKYVKNKDTIVMSITRPFIFDFEREGDDVMKLSMSIETIQNITPFEHAKYICKPVSISPTSFNQLCRSFAPTSTTINIEKSHGQVSVSNDTGISSRTLIFGNKTTETNDTEMVVKTFYTEQFSRISKLSSFISRPIEAYVEHDKPVYLKCISDIGNVNVYINVS